MLEMGILDPTKVTRTALQRHIRGLAAADDRGHGGRGLRRTMPRRHADMAVERHGVFGGSGIKQPTTGALFTGGGAMYRRPKRPQFCLRAFLPLADPVLRASIRSRIGISGSKARARSDPQSARHRCQPSWRGQATFKWRAARCHQSGSRRGRPASCPKLCGANAAQARLRHREHGQGLAAQYTTLGTKPPAGRHAAPCRKTPVPRGSESRKRSWRRSARRRAPPARVGRAGPHAGARP